MSARISLIALALFALPLSGRIVIAEEPQFVFGIPTNLGRVVNTSSQDMDPSISSDGLSLFFSSARDGGHDLWVSARATTEDAWGAPVKLGPIVNSLGQEFAPSISADGLSLFFCTTIPGSDLWVSDRPTIDSEWSAPVKLGATINSTVEEFSPGISADGLSLFFTSDRAGGSGGADMWVSRRATTEDPWGAPVNVGPIVNSPHHEVNPDVSADGLTLFFASDRPGGHGGWDLYLSVRATAQDPWSPPVNLGPSVNSSDEDAMPNISADASILYFTSTRPGGSGVRDIWQVSVGRVPSGVGSWRLYE